STRYPAPPCPAAASSKAALQARTAAKSSDSARESGPFNGRRNGNTGPASHKAASNLPWFQSFSVCARSCAGVVQSWRSAITRSIGQQEIGERLAILPAVGAEVTQIGRQDATVAQMFGQHHQ